MKEKKKKTENKKQSGITKHNIGIRYDRQTKRNEITWTHCYHRQCDQITNTPVIVRYLNRVTLRSYEKQVDVDVSATTMNYSKGLVFIVAINYRTNKTYTAINQYI